MVFAMLGGLDVLLRLLHVLNGVRHDLLGGLDVIDGGLHGSLLGAHFPQHGGNSLQKDYRRSSRAHGSTDILRCLRGYAFSPCVSKILE
jgi:hypothetical protein